MNRRISTLAITTMSVSLLLITFLFSPVQGATILVPTDYSTIQAAIDAAYSGDTIIVSANAYNENLQINGKDIILQSTDPTNPGVVGGTVIDGSLAGSVITFNGDETSACVITGFTIQTGRSAYGGGINGSGTKATISHNIIAGNDASGFMLSGYGGGIYDCDGLIHDNEITINTSTSNGAGLASCDGTIRNNIISYNTSSSGYGGGLASCEARIFNNLIVNNEASSYGGGLYNCEGIIFNNTIADNSAGSYGGGMRGCRGFFFNNIFWDNTASSNPQISLSSTPIYSCIEGWTGGGVGNTADDPQFLGGGDYQISNLGSCFNSGSIYYLPNLFLADLDGQCRVAGSGVDIGCYELTATAWNNVDSDGDLLSDYYETSAGTSSSNPDHDGDGLYDGAESFRGTSPTVYNAPTGLTVGSTDSIQEAMFYALAGEEVTVVDTDTYEETVFFLNKNIILQSADPLDFLTVATTTISVSDGSSNVFFCGDEASSAMLNGLNIQAALWGPPPFDDISGILGFGTNATIQNCKITYNAGPGIENCDGLIQNNNILENLSILDGGGLSYCDGTITGNTISDNVGQNGGGLAFCNGYISGNTINGNGAPQDGGGLYECNGEITGNDIFDNLALTGCGLAYCSGIIDGNDIYQNIGGIFAGAPYLGGGLAYCGHIDGGAIQNNRIYENQAELGGGMYYCFGKIQNNLIYSNSTVSLSGYSNGGGVYFAVGEFRNNVIYGNTAETEGGGVFIEYVASPSIVSATMTNNIIYGNTAPTNPQCLFEYGDPDYCCIEGWTGGGTGNITSNPLFSNAAGGDFTLQATSPCIDAGGGEYDLDFDIDGNPRPQDDLSVANTGDGSTYDIGAYETAGTNLEVENWDEWR